MNGWDGMGWNGIDGMAWHEMAWMAGNILVFSLLLLDFFFVCLFVSSPPPKIFY